MKKILIIMIICILFSISVNAVVISDDELRFYYNFNSSLNLSDYTGVNNLTIKGDTTYYSKTPLDYGYNFSENNYIGHGLTTNDTVSNSITGNLSIGGIFYVKNRPASGVQHLISKYNEYTGTTRRSYYLGVDADNGNCKGNVSFAISSTVDTFTGRVYCTNITVPLNEWFDIVAVYEKNASFSIYINGVNQSLWAYSGAAIAASIADSNASLGIGGTGNGNNTVNGSIEEAFGFARVLTSDEALQYHTNRLVGQGLLYDNESNATVNWNFESGRLLNYTSNATHVEVWNYDDPNMTNNALDNYNQRNSWIYFEVNDIYNKNITYNIYNVCNSTNYSSDFWCTQSYRTEPVYNCDDSEDWNRITGGNLTAGSLPFTFSLSVPCHKIKIATYFPYDYNRSLNLKNEFNQSIYNDEILNLSFIGYSYEGREMYAYRITNKSVSDVDKKIIFLVSGLHPGETWGKFQNEGLIRHLLNLTNIESYNMRNHFIFYVVPFMSPDGSVNGSARGQYQNGLYYDPNRDFPTLAMNTTKNLVNYMINEGLNSSTKNISIYMDVHGDGGNTIDGYVNTASNTSTSNYNIYKYIADNSSYSLSGYNYYSSLTSSTSIGFVKTFTGTPAVNTYEIGMKSTNETINDLLNIGKLISQGVYYTLIYSLPVTNVTITPLDANYKNDLTCNGVASSIETESGSTYRWFKDNVLITGQTSKILPGNLGYGNGGYNIKCEYTFSNGLANATPVNSSSLYINSISTSGGGASIGGIDPVVSTMYTITPNNFNVIIKKNSFIYQDFTINNVLGNTLLVDITSSLDVRNKNLILVSGQYETIFFKISGDRAIGDYVDNINIKIIDSLGKTYNEVIPVRYTIIFENSNLLTTISSELPETVMNIKGNLSNIISKKYDNTLFIIGFVIVIILIIGIFTYIIKYYMG